MGQAVDSPSTLALVLAVLYVALLAGAIYFLIVGLIRLVRLLDRAPRMSPPRQSPPPTPSVARSILEVVRFVGPLAVALLLGLCSLVLVEALRLPLLGIAVTILGLWARLLRGPPNGDE